MKKSFIILAAAFTLASCGKEAIVEPINENETQATEIIFDFSATYPDDTATKAVKTGWEPGDVLFVFFSNVPAPKFLKMRYNGSSWSNTQMNGDTVEPLGLSNGDSGVVRAVYLPFGSDVTISADGTNFVFSETFDAFWMWSAKMDYTVAEGKVSASFNMPIPEGFVQFFLDDADASSSTEIELREPHLKPQYLNYIASDCSCNYIWRATGAPLKGYVYEVKKPNISPVEYIDEQTQDTVSEYKKGVKAIFSVTDKVEILKKHIVDYNYLKAQSIPIKIAVLKKQYDFQQATAKIQAEFDKINKEVNDVEIITPDDKEK